MFEVFPKFILKNCFPTTIPNSPLSETDYLGVRPRIQVKQVCKIELEPWYFVGAEIRWWKVTN